MKTDFAPEHGRQFQVSAADLAKYAGVYRTSRGAEIKIGVEGHHLQVESTVRMIGPYYPASRERFFPLTTSPDFVFSQGENGAMTVSAGLLRAVRRPLSLCG